MGLWNLSKLIEEMKTEPCLNWELNFEVQQYKKAGTIGIGDDGVGVRVGRYLRLLLLLGLSMNENENETEEWGWSECE